MTAYQILDEFDVDGYFVDDINLTNIYEYLLYFERNGILIQKSLKSGDKEQAWRVNGKLRKPLADMIESAELMDGNIRANVKLWNDACKYEALSELVSIKDGTDIIEQMAVHDKHTIAEFDIGHDTPYSAPKCRRLCMMGFIEREKLKNVKGYFYTVQPKLKDCYCDFLNKANAFEGALCKVNEGVKVANPIF